MVSKIKIVLIAAITAVGIATPALASEMTLSTYSVPSEAPGYGSQTSVHGAVSSQENRHSVVRDRGLYDSAVAPNADYGWAYDAQNSSTAYVVR